MAHRRRCHIVHEFVVRYSEGAAREAVWRFVGRRVRHLFDLKLCVALLVLIGTLCFGLYRGEQARWVAWLSGAIALILLGMLIGVIGQSLATLWRIRQMKVPMARVVVNDVEISLASELGSATIPWVLISEIWEFEQVWLLVMTKAYFIALPIDGVPVVALEFMRSRVGAKSAVATPSSAP